MNVKIYRPSKNTMQSGLAKRNSWVLEYDNDVERKTEPLMGWTSSDSTLSQVQIKFKSCEDAVSFAEKKGWDYVVLADQNRRIKPRNYTDNFK